MTRTVQGLLNHLLLCLLHMVTRNLQGTVVAGIARLRGASIKMTTPAVVAVDQEVTMTTPPTLLMAKSHLTSHKEVATPLQLPLVITEVVLITAVLGRVGHLAAALLLPTRLEAIVVLMVADVKVKLATIMDVHVQVLEVVKQMNLVALIRAQLSTHQVTLAKDLPGSCHPLSVVHLNLLVAIAGLTLTPPGVLLLVHPIRLHPGSVEKGLLVIAIMVVLHLFHEGEAPAMVVKDLTPPKSKDEVATHLILLPPAMTQCLQRLPIRELESYSGVRRVSGSSSHDQVLSVHRFLLGLGLHQLP